MVRRGLRVQACVGGSGRAPGSVQCAPTSTRSQGATAASCAVRPCPCRPRCWPPGVMLSTMCCDLFCCRPGFVRFIGKCGWGAYDAHALSALLGWLGHKPGWHGLIPIFSCMSQMDKTMGIRSDWKKRLDVNAYHDVRITKHAITLNSSHFLNEPGKGWKTTRSPLRFARTLRKHLVVVASPSKLERREWSQ